MPLSWLAGCVLCALGSLSSSSGLALQKHAINVGEERLPFLSRRTWWLGFFLAVVLAGALESVALALAPLSLLSPMFGLSIVFNSLISSKFLSERLSSRGVFATLVICAGTTLTSFSGSHSSTLETAESLLAQFSSPLVLCYFFTIITLSCACLYITKFPRLSPHGFANAAALLGSTQTLFLKATMDILATGVTPLKPFLVFCASSSLVFFLGFLQLAILNKGLRDSPAISYLSEYKSLLTVYGVIAGGVAFSEFEGMGATQFAIFGSGVLMVLVGLAGMAAAGVQDDRPAISSLAPEGEGEGDRML